MHARSCYFLAIGAALLVSCDSSPKKDSYTLSNAKGMKAVVITYGARVMSLTAPDRNGNMGDVVLGFDSPAGYTQNNPYFGAIVGRYGNRIAKGRFALDGVDYKLAVNNG